MSRLVGNKASRSCVFSSSIVPNGGCTKRRKIGRVPASSQRLDKEHARVQAATLNINGVSLVSELDRLRGDDLEVRVDPAFVTIRKKLKRFLSRRDRLLLPPKPNTEFGDFLGFAFRKEPKPLILKDWLGGLDSNQDSQIQNLESCQLDDLPEDRINTSDFLLFAPCAEGALDPDLTRRDGWRRASPHR